MFKIPSPFIDVIDGNIVSDANVLLIESEPYLTVRLQPALRIGAEVAKDGYSET